MAESFDPYHKWLGIPPAEQPPNHYRLLGIGVFESDPDVIEQAADRQMSHVQTHKTGSHSAFSQKLLNELAAAKLCLLNQADKAGYDAMLRQRLSPPPVAQALSPSPPTVSPPAAPNPSVGIRPAPAPLMPPPPFVATTPSHAMSRSKRSGGPLLVLAAVGAAALAVGAMVYYAALKPAGKQHDPVAAKPKTTSTKKPAAKPAPAAAQRAAVVAPPTSTPPEPVGEDIKPEAEDPVSPPELAAPHPPEKIENATPSAATPPDAAADAAAMPPPSDAAITGPVDLLELIDAKRDAVLGEWRREGANLVSPQRGGWLMLPHEVPSAYVLDIETRRLSGRDLLGLGLVIDGVLAEAVLDGWKGASSGLHTLDGLEANDERNETRRAAPVLRDQFDNSIQCLVDKYGVTVRCNGREIFDFSGDARRLSFGGGFRTARNDRLYLGAAEADYLFSKYTLTPLDVADRRLHDFADSAQRLNVPDNKALRDAEKQVRQLVRERRTAGKNPSAKIALARSLLEKAAEPAEPAIRYTMYQEAIGQAAAAGDYPEAVGAILTVCREFDVSPLALKRQALAQVNGAVRAASRKMLLADDALRLLAEAVLANDYETAEEAGRLAAVMARASKDRRRIDQVRDRVKDVAELRREYDKLAAYRERLQEAPDDAEAHYALGEFECVWKRNWPIGTAHLGLGGDAVLRQLVQDELLNSRDATAKRALADRWLALAQSLTDEARASYQVRGIEWFERAAAGARAAAGGELKNKIDALVRDSSIADRPRRWLEQARAAFVQEAEIDGAERVEWFNVPGDFAIDRSWSLTLEFAGAKPDSHGVLFIIGDGRLACDPIVVAIDGDKLVGRVDDSRDSSKSFSINCRLSTARLDQWHRLRLSYRHSDRSLIMELDGAQAAAGKVTFSPFIDRPMPIWICCVNGRSQRFTGKVRMISLAND